MKEIMEGIVFSDDIEKIMKGENALDFCYEDRGLMLPSSDFFQELRRDFDNSAKEIFNGKVKILTEDEMTCGMNEAVKDVYRRYPHCNA